LACEHNIGVIPLFIFIHSIFIVVVVCLGLGLGFFPSLLENGCQAENKIVGGICGEFPSFRNLIWNELWERKCLC
jgi:hypothetical protein